MILVDTSVWVRHFRSGDAKLVGLLNDLQVVSCDVVLGELFLGAGLPAGAPVALADLPRVSMPSSADTTSFIERHHRTFRAAGVGWADAQIICAAADAGALLYSADKPQRAVWRGLGFRVV